MAFNHIVSTSTGSINGGATVTTSGINTAGANLIIAGMSYYDVTEPSLTDSKGNTWIALTAYELVTNAGIKLFYCVSPTVGTGHTFSASGGTAYPTLSVSAFSGVDTYNPLDRQTGAVTAGGGTTYQPGSLTPSRSNSLLVTAISTIVTNHTIDSAFNATTTDYLDTQHMGGGIAYKIQTTKSGENPTWTFGGSTAKAAAMAVFNPATPPGIQYKLQDNTTGSLVVAAEYGTTGELRFAAGTASVSTTGGPSASLPRYFTLNGLNQDIHCTFGNSGVGQNSPGITLMTWFKIASGDTTEQRSMVFVNGNDYDGLTRALLTMNESGQVYGAGRALDSDSAKASYMSGSFDDNTWHHAATILDYPNNKITVYVDAISGAQTDNGVSFGATASQNTPSIHTTVGSRRQVEFWKGGLADARIYEYALTSGQIRTAMLEGMESGGGDSGGSGGSGGSTGIQNFGSMISIMIPGRQWLAYPNTVSTGEMYSLVTLYDGSYYSSSSGSGSGSSITLDGVDPTNTYASGGMSLANRLSVFDLTYTYGLGSITVVGTGIILGTLFSTQTIQYNYSPYLTNATGYTGGIEQLGNIVVHGGLRIPYIRDMNNNVTILSDTMKYRLRNDESLAISGVIANISSGYRFVVNARNENNQPINLTTLSGSTILFTKPDSTVIRSATSYVTDGTDGSVYTITSGNQFSTNGRWYLQLQTTGIGAIYTSKKYRFKVG